DVGVAVLRSELLLDLHHARRIGDRRRVDAQLGTVRGDADRRVLQEVPVPLRVRAADGEEVERVPFLYEPDRVGDRAPGPPPGDGDLDLACALQRLGQVSGCHFAQATASPLCESESPRSGGTTRPRALA